MENDIIPIDNAVMFNMVMSKKENCQGFIERTLGIKVGLVSEQLNAFLNYVVTQEPTDEYTKSLHDDVKIYSKDAKRRQAMMTVQDDIDFMNFLHKQKLAKKDAEIADKDAELAKQAAEIERLKAELAAKEQKD